MNPIIDVFTRVNGNIQSITMPEAKASAMAFYEDGSICAGFDSGEIYKKTKEESWKKIAASVGQITDLQVTPDGDIVASTTEKVCFLPKESIQDQKSSFENGHSCNIRLEGRKLTVIYPVRPRCTLLTFGTLSEGKRKQEARGYSNHPNGRDLTTRFDEFVQFDDGGFAISSENRVDFYSKDGTPRTTVSTGIPSTPTIPKLVAGNNGRAVVLRDHSTVMEYSSAGECFSTLFIPGPMKAVTALEQNRSVSAGEKMEDSIYFGRADGEIGKFGGAIYTIYQLNPQDSNSEVTCIKWIASNVLAIGRKNGGLQVLDLANKTYSHIATEMTPLARIVSRVDGETTSLLVSDNLQLGHTRAFTVSSSNNGKQETAHIKTNPYVVYTISAVCLLAIAMVWHQLSRLE